MLTVALATPEDTDTHNGFVGRWWCDRCCTELFSDADLGCDYPTDPTDPLICLDCADDEETTTVTTDDAPTAPAPGLFARLYTALRAWFARPDVDTARRAIGFTMLAAAVAVMVVLTIAEHGAAIGPF